MQLMLIGQKWLGAETLKLCLARGHTVEAVCTPSTDDRLARLACEHGIAQITATRVQADHVPDGLDLLLCAHTHAFITREAKEIGRAHV